MWGSRQINPWTEISPEQTLPNECKKARNRGNWTFKLDLFFSVGNLAAVEKRNKISKQAVRCSSPINIPH